MKLITRHIKKFEQFIQNPKDPNKEKAKTKEFKKKTPEPELIPEEDDEDQEGQDEQENDEIDELNEYFKKFKK